MSFVYLSEVVVYWWWLVMWWECVLVEVCDLMC